MRFHEVRIPTSPLVDPGRHTKAKCRGPHWGGNKLTLYVKSVKAWQLWPRAHPYFPCVRLISMTSHGGRIEVTSSTLRYELYLMVSSETVGAGVTAGTRPAVSARPGWHSYPYTRVCGGRGPVRRRDTHLSILFLLGGWGARIQIERSHPPLTKCGGASEC